MPSPVGHAMAGIACAWVVSGAPAGVGRRSRLVKDVLLFGALGMLPDIDLVFGAHSGPTHSIGAAAIVAIAALIVRAAFRRQGSAAGGVPTAAFVAACAAAYGSHVVLDWMASDSTPPIGVMALWPFSRQHYESDLHVFMAISRRYHQGWSFLRHNTLALARELAILLPILSLLLLFRRRAA